LVRCDAYARSHESRRRELAQWVAEGTCFIAELEGKTVGLVVVEQSFFGHGFISLVCVEESLRGRGHALELLAFAECRCGTDKLFTSTNASNVAARRLFARAGFAPSGSIENLDQGDTELVYYKFVGWRGG